MPVYKYNEFLKIAKNFCDSEKSKQIAAIIINFEELFELDCIFGHSAVDSILKDAANRLLNSLREKDIVGIFGRYQLACLLPNLSNPTQAELAGYKILRIYGIPFSYGDHKIIVSVRVGIAISSPVLAGDSSKLFRQAHVALNQASKDREPLKIYSSTIDKFLVSELELLSDFEIAIHESRLRLTYQPQLNLQNGKIEGSEALLRWTHPTRGSIPTDLMINLAEKTGLISKLTFWVFHTAIRQCSEYRKAGLDIGVSVNLSAQNLNEPDLIGIITQVLSVWNVPTDQVIIEITETTIMHDHLLAEKILSQFKEIGCQIALDDFGTGYSSLALLHKLPIDKLKIDKSFIIDMLQNPESEEIVDSIISLAHKLKIVVIAEGVEDIATCNRLRELKCDFIQGYLLSPSLPLPEFIDFVLSCNPEIKSSKFNPIVASIIKGNAA